MVGSSLMTNGWAQKGGTAKHSSKAVVNMQAQGAGGLSVSFVSLPDGAGMAGQRALDLGSVSYAGRPRTANVQARPLADRLVVSTKLGLAVQDPSGHCSSATLLVSLAYPDPAHVLRLDGVRLATTPQLIQGQMPVGKTSAHRLEIEVPTSLTEKDAGVHNSIIFQVVPN
jgi:hypothetical protein